MQPTENGPLTRAAYYILQVSVTGVANERAD